MKSGRPRQTLPFVIHCPIPSGAFCSLHIWKASEVIHTLNNTDGVLTVNPALGWELEGNAGALALD